MALGREVDIAVNHNAEALAMHAANHPGAAHLIEDVFSVDIGEATNGQPVGLAWFSPDCTHHSKARGGKPRSKNIRGLAWVAVKWAYHPTASPRVIILENVEEFEEWGPLMDNNLPDPCLKGDTFREFVARLRYRGYEVDWKVLRGCDYGAPTIRKRLFLVARRDGAPIVWPDPTHGKPDSMEVLSGHRAPWHTAAECIDWSIPCPSIFLSKEEAKLLGIKRPLADNTMERIFMGIMKFVIKAQDPFIIPLTHCGGDRVEDIRDPFKIITTEHRGEKALVMPFLTEHANGSSQRNFDIQEPLRTQCAQVKGGHFAAVTAFLAKHYTPESPAPRRTTTARRATAAAAKDTNGGYEKTKSANTIFRLPLE